MACNFGRILTKMFSGWFKRNQTKSFCLWSYPNIWSPVFQRLSMTTKNKENQCPTSTFTWTSAFKMLSISTPKNDWLSTFAFKLLRMITDQYERKIKPLKEKTFHKKNNDEKIHNHVASCMKRKLFVDIENRWFLDGKAKTHHVNKFYKWRRSKSWWHKSSRKIKCIYSITQEYKLHVASGSC